MTYKEINGLEISLGGEPHPENEHQRQVAKLCALARLGLWAKQNAIPALEYYQGKTLTLHKGLATVRHNDVAAFHIAEEETWILHAQATNALNNKP